MRVESIRPGMATVAAALLSHGTLTRTRRARVSWRALALVTAGACARGTPPAPPPPPEVRPVEGTSREAGPDLPPTLTVSGNAPQGEVPYGTLVTLSATCVDREDGALGTTRWFTDDGRVLGDSSVLRILPEPGRYLILASCNDRGGRATTVAASAGFTVIDRWTAADSVPVTITVPFGTNRGGGVGPSAGDAFGGAARDTLVRGVLMANLPSRDFRRSGAAVRTPFMQSVRGNTAAADVARYALREVTPVDSGALAALLSGRLSATPAGDVLAFVHGYYTSFGRAAERAVRLAGEVQWPGVVALYSWPSDARLVRYREDQRDARAAGRHLAAYLRELHDAVPGRRLHLVSHSMGAEALAAALRHLDSTGATLRLGEVVLVAPDIAADDFLSGALPSLRARAERVTVYAASADFALWSSWGSNRVRRLGLGGRFATVARDVDTVEVPYSATDRLGHNPFLSESFRDELYRLLVERRPVTERGLLTLPLADGKVMWRLP